MEPITAMIIGLSDSEVAQQIRKKINHLDADLLQKKLYIGDYYPYLVSSPYVHGHCITKARQHTANRIFHQQNGRPEIHHDLLRHRLGAPSSALRS
jgi:uncharacterized protein YraI